MPRDGWALAPTFNTCGTCSSIVFPDLYLSAAPGASTPSIDSAKTVSETDVRLYDGRLGLVTLAIRRIGGLANPTDHVREDMFSPAGRRTRPPLSIQPAGRIDPLTIPGTLRNILLETAVFPGRRLADIGAPGIATSPVSVCRRAPRTPSVRGVSSPHTPSDKHPLA